MSDEQRSFLREDLEEIAGTLSEQDVRAFMDGVNLMVREVEEMTQPERANLGGGMQALCALSFREANRRLLEDQRAPLSQAWLRWHCAIGAGIVAGQTEIPDSPEEL
jgi:hypothetical protein